MDTLEKAVGSGWSRGPYKKETETELFNRARNLISEYIIDFNLDKARKRAGFKHYTTAKRLLHSEQGKQLLRTMIAERSARMNITQDDVVRRLWEESDMSREGTSGPSRVAALKLLGQHIGMSFSENTRSENVHTGEVKLTIVREIVSVKSN